MTAQHSLKKFVSHQRGGAVAPSPPLNTPLYVACRTVCTCNSVHVHGHTVNKTIIANYDSDRWTVH